VPKDWLAWHEPYDDPSSSLAHRLAAVQVHIARAIDACAPGPIRLLSMCAGQGRDLLGVLPDHPRRDDVRALLVELDPRNVEHARARIEELALDDVSVVDGDAALTDSYAPIVPVDVALVCGVFGNVVDDDIAAAIRLLPMLLAPGGTVVWTRFPREPELLPRIDEWFRDTGFETVAVETGAGTDGSKYGLGVHRLAVEPRPSRSGVRLFTFVDDPDPTGANERRAQASENTATSS
jgi:SAM-dependent methyltransferase